MNHKKELWIVSSDGEAPGNEVPRQRSHEAPAQQPQQTLHAYGRVVLSRGSGERLEVKPVSLPQDDGKPLYHPDNTLKGTVAIQVHSTKGIWKLRSGLIRTTQTSFRLAAVLYQTSER